MAESSHLAQCRRPCFIGPWTAPRRPAGEHHEHSGARNRPCSARRGIEHFLSGLRKPKGRASSASAGCGGGRVCGLAPGFYPRRPPVGAAPKIEWEFQKIGDTNAVPKEPYHQDVNICIRKYPKIESHHSTAKLPKFRRGAFASCLVGSNPMRAPSQPRRPGHTSPAKGGLGFCKVLRPPLRMQCGKMWAAFVSEHSRLRIPPAYSTAKVSAACLVRELFRR